MTLLNSLLHTKKGITAVKFKKNSFLNMFYTILIYNKIN